MEKDKRGGRLSERGRGVREEINMEEALGDESNRDISYLWDISRVLGAEYNSREFLNKVLEQVVKYLKVSKATILLRNKKGKLSIRAYKGMSPDLAEKVSVTPGDRIAGWVYETGNPLLIRDIEKDPRFGKPSGRRYKSRSFLCYPLKTRSRVIGVINVNDKTNGESFNDYDLHLLGIIATEAGMRLETISLHNRLMVTIRSLKKSNFKHLKERRRLESLINNISDALVLKNSQGRIVLKNDTAEELLFQSHRSTKRITIPQSKKDMPLECDNFTDNEFRRLLESHVGRLRRGELKISEEFETYDKNKGKVHLLVLSTVIKKNDARVQNYLHLIRDISIEKETEEKKQEFISLISHELRTPLTPLKTYMTLLLEGSMGRLNEAAHETLEIMMGQLRRLELEIKNLLFISNLNSDDVVPFWEEVELNALVKETLEKYEFLGRQRGINFQLKSNSERVIIRSDPKLISIILANLLANGIKFSSKGENINITITDGDKYGDEIDGKMDQLEEDSVYICIEDQGIGIPRNDQERIFKMFEQVESPLTRRHGGSGLGLYIVRRLTEICGGRIWVNSRMGRGSRFFLMFHKQRKSNYAKECGTICSK